MKKTFFIIIVLLLSSSSKSQNTGVEKSIYAIQTGILGVWVNNEYRLSNEISLKSELGMIAGLRGCSSCNTEYILAPEITIEPRWYYNIQNRSKKGKVIKSNSSNFVTLGFKYVPDWFVISNEANATVKNQISIIPKWGIKRSIANSNFNYELGIGIGKRYYIDSSQWDTAADLLIRIGYTFKRK
jgi:hypothetical protein